MTGFLLDTKVISEPSKAKPNVAVLRWLEATQEQRLFLSVLTFGEINRGVESLPASKKRERYEQFIALLEKRFDGRILAVDRSVAERWGLLVARCSAAGRPMPTIDALLAATALVHGLTIVTRNVDDFRRAEVAVVNPFD